MWFHLHEMPRIGKSKEIEKLVFARGNLAHSPQPPVAYNLWLCKSNFKCEAILFYSFVIWVFYESKQNEESNWVFGDV